MPYGGEAKIRGSPLPMGSPPDFLAFDPESPKWGDAEAGERSTQSGEQSKDKLPEGGGPERSRAPPRLRNSKAYDKEGRPPLQELDIRLSPVGKQQEKPLSRKPGTNLQHREEARRQK